MSQSHRAQILMDPDEYKVLARLAEQRRVSVAELIRSAVRAHYFGSLDEKLEAVAHVAALSLPVSEWPEMKREIEEAYDGGLP